MHGRFRDAVHVDETGGAVGVLAMPFIEASEVKRFAAEDHVTQALLAPERRSRSGGLYQLIEGRRSLIEDRHTLANKKINKVAGARLVA